MFRWVTIFICLLVTWQCKRENVETTAQVKTVGGSEQAHGEIYDYFLDQAGAKKMLAVVNPQSLSLSFLGAGLETNRIGRFVRLYFDADIQRDYLQILRCLSVSRGEIGCRFNKGIYDVSSDDIGGIVSGEVKETINTEGQYDCWNKIRGNSACKLLADGKVYTSEAYLDISAPSGNRYFYIARVCVVKGRVNDMYGTENCSPAITVSNDVDLPVYKLKTKIDKAHEEIDKLATRLNDITKRAYHLTVKLSTFMAEYEEELIKNNRAKRLREGIAMIAGMAVGVAGSIYTMSTMPPTYILKEAVGKEVSKKTTDIVTNQGRGFRQLVFETGATEDVPLPDMVKKNPPLEGAVGSGLEAGKALGAAFADIVASVDDYPKACPECESVRADIAELVGNIKPENYADEIDMDIMKQSQGYLYDQLLADYATAIGELRSLQRKEDENVIR